MPPVLNSNVAARHVEMNAKSAHLRQPAYRFDHPHEFIRFRNRHTETRRYARRAEPDSDYVSLNDPILEFVNDAGVLLKRVTKDRIETSDRLGCPPPPFRRTVKYH